MALSKQLAEAQNCIQTLEELQRAKELLAIQANLGQDNRTKPKSVELETVQRGSERTTGCKYIKHRKANTNGKRI